ncbi:hypothetical protein ACHAWF_017770 [Thalassiosira exigua]
MGGRRLVSCGPGDDRDKVARILEESHTHHVVVFDGENFVGLVSSWDVAAECSKDNRAWPYLRDEHGKVPFPVKAEKDEAHIPPSYDPQKPTSILNHKHNANTYMDDLDLEAFQ